MRTVTPNPAAVDLQLVRQMCEAINQAALGILQPSVAVTGTYTAGLGDLVVLIAPSGTCTITLPAASQTTGSIRRVKRSNNTTHVVTIQAAAGNIDGAASTSLTTAYQSRAFYSDGSNYWLV
ncbi:MAG: hypothetical protein ACRCV5_20290 [Afipia sp.]